MHPALERLIDANTALESAEKELAAARERRRECALGLAAIESEDERWHAALLAYREFGKGLSIALAEAATGIPGKRSQSEFLVRAGRMTYQPKGRRVEAATPHTPMSEWPIPHALEREIIQSHIRHNKPYVIYEGLGWQRIYIALQPRDAEVFLRDPNQGLANALGLSRDEFLEYLSSEGAVRCDAITQKGERCRAGVAGVSSQLDVAAWKQANDAGGYCARHGG